MSLLRRKVSTRCSGNKDNQCQNFINKTSLPTHKRHCPDCGSSLTEDTKPNVPAIVGLVTALVVSAGGIGYFVWPKLGTKVSKSPTSTVPISTPTPNVKVSIQSPKTPAKDPSVSATPTLTTDNTPSATPTIAPKPQPPITLPPPQPIPEQIQNVMKKLQTRNPNEKLEFPLEENVNYRIVGFQDSNGQPWGLNVQNIKDFLEISLKTNGKFPPDSKIDLIVVHNSTQERLILKSYEKNDLLGRLVRSLSVMQ